MDRPLATLRAMMIKVCARSAVPEEHIDQVVDHYLEGELRGHSTHGVSKFCFESQFFAERLGPPRIVRIDGGLAVVDGNREIGPITAAFAIELVARRARQLGVGLVGVQNTQRYGVLSDWGERLARAGLLGIVMNTSRAEVTVPGARDPFLGVNTFCFGIPTSDEPFVVDFSSTRAPLGNLWDARRGDATLRPGAFIDDAGRITDDPHTARSALIPTDHRSLALSMLIQALTGALFGFPMGPEVDSTWTTGYTFLAVDPAHAGGLDTLQESMSRFLTTAAAALGAADDPELRLPGTRSRRLRHERLARGSVPLPDSVFARLLDLASG